MSGKTKAVGRVSPMRAAGTTTNGAHEVTRPTMLCEDSVPYRVNREITNRPLSGQTTGNPHRIK